MRTVENLIEQLKQFPPDAMCYAYEGETIGIIINPPARMPRGGNDQGQIDCSSTKEIEDAIYLPEWATSH